VPQSLLKQVLLGRRLSAPLVGAKSKDGAVLKRHSSDTIAVLPNKSASDVVAIVNFPELRSERSGDTEVDVGTVAANGVVGTEASNDADDDDPAGTDANAGTDDAGAADGLEQLTRASTASACRLSDGIVEAAVTDSGIKSVAQVVEPDASPPKAHLSPSVLAKTSPPFPSPLGAPARLLPETRQNRNAYLLELLADPDSDESSSQVFDWSVIMLSSTTKTASLSLEALHIFLDRDLDLNGKTVRRSESLLIEELQRLT